MRSTRNISIDGAAVAARLSSLRQARGWTKQELADVAGLSERTVRLLEQGQRAVVLEKTLLLLAAALAVTPTDLLGPAAADTEPAPTAETPKDPTPPLPARSRRRTRVALAGFLGLMLLAGTGFGLAVRASGGAVPLNVHADKHVLNVSGELVTDGSWSRTFQSTIVFAEPGGWQDGTVLVGLGFDALDGGRVILLDGRSGATIWERAPDPAGAVAAYGPECLDGLESFGPICREYLDLDGDGTLELAVAFIHVRKYPSNVLVVKHTGEMICDYFHRGHVYDLAGADLDGDGASELICAGTNNARGFGGGTVFVLDRTSRSGAAVDSLTGGEASVVDSSRRRVLVPGLDAQVMGLLAADRLDADSIHVTRAGRDGTRIMVRLGAVGCHFHLVLDSDLNPLAIRPNDNVARTMAGWPSDVRSRFDLTDPGRLERWRESIVVLGQQVRYTQPAPSPMQSSRQRPEVRRETVARSSTPAEPALGSDTPVLLGLTDPGRGR
jgi:transcriptional regulator with XRE-family HTH domain